MVKINSETWEKDLDGMNLSEVTKSLLYNALSKRLQEKEYTNTSFSGSFECLKCEIGQSISIDGKQYDLSFKEYRLVIGKNPNEKGG